MEVKVHLNFVVIEIIVYILFSHWKKKQSRFKLNLIVIQFIKTIDVYGQQVFIYSWSSYYNWDKFL